MNYIKGFFFGLLKYVVALIGALFLLVLSVPLAIIWPNAVVDILFYGSKVVETHYKKKLEGNQ